MFRRRDKRPLLLTLREALYPRRGWSRSVEYLSHRVKRLPDTPHRIALGVACGVAVSFTPLFGFHLLLAAGLALALGGNVVAALLGTFVGNPLTFPLIASVSLGLGRRILGYGVTGRDFDRVIDALAEAVTGIWRSLRAAFGAGEPAWDRLAPLFTDLVWPYLLGGLLPGLIAAVASYCLARPLVAAYQRRRQGARLGLRSDGHRGRRATAKRQRRREE